MLIRYGMMILSMMIAMIMSGCGASGPASAGGGGGGGGGGAPAGPSTKVYVVNMVSSNVAVINTVTNTVVTTIPVGASPSAIAINNTTNRAYISNTGSSNISVIDTITNTVIGTIPAIPSVGNLTINPLTNKLYATSGAGSNVAVIDTISNTVVATIPITGGVFDIAINPGNNKLYATNLNGVTVVNTLTNVVSKTIPIVLPPNRVAIDTLTAKVYIAGMTQNWLWTIDGLTDTLSPATITTGGFIPRAIAVNPNDSFVYVSQASNNSVSVIDKNGVLQKTWAVGWYPEALAINPQNNYLYVANKNDNNVTIYSNISTTFLNMGAIATGSAPVAIAVATPNQAPPVFPTIPGLGINWTQHPMVPSTDNLKSVATDLNQYVAVGAGGIIKTSIDGITWTYRTSGTTSNLNNITFQNGQFIAVGDMGTILTSPDGITWTRRVSGTTAILNGMTFGAAQYVAVGASGTVITSPDCITWTARTSSVSVGLNSVTFGAGQFIAVGDGATLITSPNAITWTLNNSAWTAATLNPGTPSVISMNLNSVVFANGKFVAAGGAGINSRVIASVDGITWTVSWGGAGWGGAQTGHVTFCNGQFIFVVPEIWGLYTSPDAVTWTLQRNPVLLSAKMFVPISITFAKGQYVGAGGTMGVSTDCIQWSRISNSPHILGVNLDSVAFGNGEFVSLTLGGLDAIHTPDGVSVISRSPIGLINPVLVSNPNSIKFINGHFAAVDNQGRLAKSIDGVTWTEAIIPGLSINGQMTNITFANGLYVAVGMYGTIATSPDFITWTVRNRMATSIFLRDVEFINGKFVAIGQAGTMITSPDGITWTATAPTITNLQPGYSLAESYGITYGNGLYVMTGMYQAPNPLAGFGSLQPSILTSTDGVNWTERSVGAANTTMSVAPGLTGYTRVIFAGGTFIIVAQRSSTFSGAILTSVDGIHWTERTPAFVTTGVSLSDIAFGNGKLMVVGNSGIITSP